MRDPANWYPSFKAPIDGLTDKKRKGQVLAVGVLSDDSDEHVVGPDMRLGVQEHPRIHLDLYAGDAADQATEVERLVSLGAQRIDWDLYPDDADFVVLAGPEGNRFCIIGTGPDEVPGILPLPAQPLPAHDADRDRARQLLPAPGHEEGHARG